ncbi:MAG: alpha-hydroxy-acid oxidizing protein, partial [Candidatus Methanoperedens sp.]|nr:alpha-hydroxy-acid oxidizing protein [Candidatus Methanoperedens sp.]
ANKNELCFFQAIHQEADVVVENVDAIRAMMGMEKDAAKSIALGASLCGIALPLVAPALKGQKDVADRLNLIIEELRVAMFLCGCRTIEELGNSALVIKGSTKEFLEQRGFETAKFGRKRYNYGVI